MYSGLHIITYLLPFCSLFHNAKKKKMRSTPSLIRRNAKSCTLDHWMIGHVHPTQYYMEDNGKSRQLQAITEKDLEIYVTSDLSQADNVLRHLRRPCQFLGMIKRNFQRITVHDFKILYNSYVQPHLEYCIQAWSPYLVSDISSLEQVQRR